MIKYWIFEGDSDKKAFNAALLSLKMKKSTTNLSRRCSQKTIDPDYISATCNECMFYILKWRSCKAWDLMRYILGFTVTLLKTANLIAWTV